MDRREGFWQRLLKIEKIENYTMKYKLNIWQQY